MNSKLFSTIFIWLAISSCHAQQRKTEVVGQVVNPSRVKKPVYVEPEPGSGHLTFYGVNNSFIPYQLELKFSQLGNLKPRRKNYKMVIDQGKTRLFDLRIRKKNISPTYNYSFRYYIGDPGSTPDADFPYLVPTAKNKNVRAVDLPTPVKGPVLLMLSTGDTLYAMRRGKVTATPENHTEIDRITPLSLEVYQPDGTLASYHTSQSKSLVREGDLVYPGQPIAVILRGGTVNVCVYRFFPNGSIAPIAVQYTLDGASLLKPDQLNGVTVAHPVKVIQKEFTKSEFLKWRKGNLYKSGQE